MMRNSDEQLSFDKPLSNGAVECLPTLAWVFLAIAFIPHTLALVGLDMSAVIASIICFPLSMGPFAVAHAYLLVSRLGFTSHMAWISALLFSIIWSVLVCWFRGRSRATTEA
jgi:hypothetical protein